ncbi:MAG: hypothetical protein LBG19_04560 [Prevotellaceae bacterium]|jgi:hypothetical protein|nr:hypothetical protein [Prevotellaceae bacterium]
MIYAKEVNAKSILGDELFNKIKQKSGLPHGLGHKYYEEIRALEDDGVLEDEDVIKKKELEKKSRDYYGLIRKIRL